MLTVQSWPLESVETITRLCSERRRRAEEESRGSQGHGGRLFRKKPKHRKIGCPLLKGSRVLDFKAPAKNEECSIVSKVKPTEKIKDGSVSSGVFQAPACESGRKRSSVLNAVTVPRCSQIHKGLHASPFFMSGVF